MPTGTIDWRGGWVGTSQTGYTGTSTITYYPMDAVYYDGSAYIAIKTASIGSPVPPVDLGPTGNWDRLAIGGLNSVSWGSYGSFSDTTDQSCPAAGATAVKHNTVDMAVGFTATNGGTRIQALQQGTYTVISSMQFIHDTGGDSTVTVWLRVDGADVPNSATDLTLKGNGKADLFTINYFVTLLQGQYIELMWSPDDTDTRIEHIPTRINPTRPAVPSVITTIAALY